ncbi:hypothetical protein M878_09605 [Streptomyces roseochromogenus subsp. oscitans DS 12.976]|uniref:Damage-control phosphatase ARMT1-like metal-binding domain-containing protein n=1 Tax=Streptomyces roseochromogenus subsp. oscitans DS 12.976 TaxID=1352936 RepID=V6KT47_STRRC|nr:hypothetical protein M878_09605 [Streptomyces roseochromogenus subsp. oscitans DS 12.976]
MLWPAMADGRLAVRAHPFSCAPLPYERMPDDLCAEFAAATLTVPKGDLNYRRLVGDRLWSPTEAAPVAVEEQRWRTSGTHALIQVDLK